MSMDAALIWIVFLFTYVGLALGKVPGLRIDRAGIALVGATLFLVTGVISLPGAMATINFETLLLLFGMMILVVHLRLGGFFQRVIHIAEKHVHTPRGLLAAVLALSAVLSALLVNDVVCVAMTPLVIRLSRRLNCHPVPHLIGLATASNIGSVATIIGNPQNMIIGIHSEISFLRFTAKLAPIAVFGLVIDFLVIAFIYRKALARTPSTNVTIEVAEAERLPGKAQRWMLFKSVTVTLIAVGLFCTDWPKDLIALGAAAFMLLGRVRPEKVFRQVDWALLLMFAGLFVVVGVFNKYIVPSWGIEHWTTLRDSPVAMLSVVSAVLSNIVSNVPAVLLFEPLIAVMPQPSRDTAWLALAMSSTLAGNFTVLGSVANLIVVESARREQVMISFWEYCRVGVPVTLLTLFVGVGWLIW